jgi:hypothetical protein
MRNGPISGEFWCSRNNVIIRNPERRIADHGFGASNVSPKDEILFGSLHCSHRSTHGYLVIDMKQETPDILRLRSHIFPGQKQIAYADI